MIFHCLGPNMTRLATYGRRVFSSTFSDKIERLGREALSGAFLRHEPMGCCQKTVLLLHPPGACSAFTRSGSQYPPLGLNQLKAIINDPSKVDVLEADGYEWTDEETAQHIWQQAPKAIGMAVTCGTKKLTHAWSTVAKHLSPSYKPLVIVGGPAASFEYQSIFDECPNVDVVVKGEGEVTFPTIVDYLEHYDQDHLDQNDLLEKLSRIPGVCVRHKPHRNDKTIPTLPKEAFQTMPFPDLSASPVAKYKAPDAQKYPMVTMMTQRGCIAQCAFCNTPQIHGRQIRGWTNEQIIDELIKLKQQHGIREVSFVDDVFTNRPGGPRKLCELMVKHELNLSWYCNVRADQITETMALAMKSAGCHQVFIGFESGCDEMLKRINKGEKVQDLERGAKILKNAGISISIGFIVGLPGESQESVNKSIDLCNRVKPMRVQFTRFTPIPGSDIANQYELDTAGKGFHDRTSRDQIEEWIQQCYDACNYRPSL